MRTFLSNQISSQGYSYFLIYNSTASFLTDVFWFMSYLMAENSELEQKLRKRQPLYSPAQDPSSRPRCITRRLSDIFPFYHSTPLLKVILIYSRPSKRSRGLVAVKSCIPRNLNRKEKLVPIIIMVLSSILSYSKRYIIRSLPSASFSHMDIECLGIKTKNET